MIRPCYLIIDRESPVSISSRKLVIETAKFNVITAYSSKEAIDILTKFPTLDGVVTDSGIPGVDCDALITSLKAITPSIPVIVVLTPLGIPCRLADYTLESFEPEILLQLLQSLQPDAASTIHQHNLELEDDYFKR